MGMPRRCASSSRPSPTTSTTTWRPCRGCTTSYAPARDSGGASPCSARRSVSIAPPTTKSGLMLGRGDRPEEVIDALRHLLDAGCELVTIGQYLQPKREKLDVVE